MILCRRAPARQFGLDSTPAQVSWMAIREGVAMKWDALGAIGELVGAGAVVVIFWDETGQKGVHEEFHDAVSEVLGSGENSYEMR